MSSVLSNMRKIPHGDIMLLACSLTLHKGDPLCPSHAINGYT